MSDYDRDAQNQSPAFDRGADAAMREGEGGTDARMQERVRGMDVGGGGFGQDLGAQGRTPVLDADMGTYGDEAAGSLKDDAAGKGESLLDRASGVFDKGVGSTEDDANSTGMAGASYSNSVRATFSDADGRTDASDADTTA